jgi:hypothetical protein
MACQPLRERPAPSVPENSEPPAIELSKAEFYDSTGNRLRAHGFAKHVFYRRDTGDAWAEDVRVNMPRPQSRSGTTTLTSPSVSGNPLESRLRAEGGVSFVNQAGDRGQTERLSYFGREGFASGDRPLTLWGPNYTLHADGFHWTSAGDLIDLGPATLVSRSDR